VIVYHHLPSTVTEMVLEPLKQNSGVASSVIAWNSPTLPGILFKYSRLGIYSLWLIRLGHYYNGQGKVGHSGRSCVRAH